jgi:hypothetical protein
MVAQERRREMKRKAAEYDALKAEKSLTKKDAEELFTKIVELNNSSKFQSSLMPSISEEAETGYNSDPVRKTSSRFSRKEAHVTHMSSRFTRF